MQTLKSIPTQNPTDLPIDIDIIGRQAIDTGRVINNIGQNLFSPEAQRVNDQLQRRADEVYATAFTLFYTADFDHSHNPHQAAQLQAGNLGLFSTQSNIIVFDQVPPTAQLPTWGIAASLLACGILGFIFAIRQANKKHAAKNQGG